MTQLSNYLSYSANRHKLMTALGVFCVVGGALVSTMLVLATFFR